MFKNLFRKTEKKGGFSFRNNLIRNLEAILSPVKKSVKKNSF